MMRSEGLMLGTTIAAQRCSGHTKLVRGVGRGVGALRYGRLGPQHSCGVLRGRGVGIRTNAAKAQGKRDESVLFRFNDAGEFDSSDTVFSVNAQASSETPPTPPKRDPDFSTISSVHFIGIGGAGLSVLAHVALEQGCTVSGSDIADGPRTEAVKKAGATVFVGHSADNLGEDVDAVVVSSAVPEGNPEVDAAIGRGIPLYKRETWLGKLTATRELVAVAGTHGKTTTSAMLSMVLKDGFDDDLGAVIGADVPQFPDCGGALHGSSKRFVLEADEYDGAFLSLLPTVALVTNVEWEHVDVYPSEEAVRESFKGFVSRVRPGGALVVCGDDGGARAVAAAAPATCRVVTYGLEPGNEWSATMLTPVQGGTDFVVVRNAMPLGRVFIPMAGIHNVLNALGVITTAALMGAAGAFDPNRTSPLNLDLADEDSFQEQVQKTTKGLEAFRGVCRRLELKHNIGDECIVYDDYAHHPTEIRASLQAARQMYQDAKIWVVFQPHTYSRLAQFYDDFVTAFSGADRVIITETFGAREESSIDEGVSAEGLAESVLGPPAAYLKDIQDAVERLVWELTAVTKSGLMVEPVVIISMGAGSITCLADRLVERMSGEIEILD
eukprot:CAMPEP_0118959110 /NCGR_PEP_ID=MMETSP1169-20130426/62964_1 /TAXON_ID=36882 /ORGANISM="Pyramimonas obovata, Strain CCMP722" /LENGTH=609 /DNA_ID=CAMNT_0006907237 /DNA_START=193 /DNA_END=2022 /DNA_ORIENTATION=-